MMFLCVALHLLRITSSMQGVRQIIRTTTIAAALASIAFTGTANAIPILTFAESPPVANAFSATNNGNGTSSLLANVPITISAIDGPLGAGVPFDGTFSLTGLSNIAARDIDGVFIQRFTGTYT